MKTYEQMNYRIEAFQFDGVELPCLDVTDDSAGSMTSRDPHHLVTIGAEIVGQSRSDQARDPGDCDAHVLRTYSGCIRRGDRRGRTELSDMSRSDSSGSLRQALRRSSSTSGIASATDRAIVATGRNSASGGRACGSSIEASSPGS